MKQCYEQVHAQRPNVRGRIALSVSVTHQTDVGNLITDAKIDKDLTTITDAEFLQCAAENPFASEAVLELLKAEGDPSGGNIVSPDEACDDGTNNGAYGGCMPGCRARAPRCGDAMTQTPPEQCDDGVNVSPYGGCAVGCVLAPRCGDGILQASYGEECDEVAATCTALCKITVE